MRVGVMLASVLPAYGANGGNMILGASNRAGKSTWLASKGPSVLKINNTGGNPVLDLRNRGGSAPMLVDSSIMVDDLNADLLDGRHATSLAPRMATVSSADLSDAGGNDMIYTNIEVPAAGLLPVGLNVDVQRTSAAGGGDSLTCGIVNNDSGTWDGSDGYGLRVSDQTGDNPAEDCTITEFHYVNAAGSYKAEGQITGVKNAEAAMGNGNLWVMWIPVDGSAGDFLG